MSGNTAQSPSKPLPNLGTGGGIFATASTVTLIKSTVSGNAAGTFGCVCELGGGIYNSSGTLELKNSTVSGNSVLYVGGGIYNQGTLTLSNSTVSGNSAGRNGGGIFNERTIVFTNSTVSGNKAEQGGGGIYNDGTADLFNSTITNNQADGDFNGTGTGGGIWNQSGSTLTFQNSIVAGNFESQLSNGTFVPAPGECAGTIISNGNNLMQNYDSSHCVVAGQPFTLADPNLGPLENNGGPTRTHALLAGSPAIDAGDPSGCPDQFGAVLLKDQRGLHRTVDGDRDGTARCDIGAYEFGNGDGVPFTFDLDFDGDGRNDIGVYRDGTWFILRSFDGEITAIDWGGLPPGYTCAGGL